MLCLILLSCHPSYSVGASKMPGRESRSRLVEVALVFAVSAAVRLTLASIGSADALTNVARLGVVVFISLCTVVR